MQENGELSLILQDEVEKAAQSIRKGRVLLYPTDTIWGLGCDIFNKSAVERVYEIKQRPRTKPFILLVDSIAMLKKYISQIHPRVETLLMHHIQPLTIIYQADDLLPDYLTSEDETIAIRVTHDLFCSKLITLHGKPIISTSANVAGKDFPTSFEDIDSDVKEMADDIVNPSLEKSGTQLPSVLARYNHKGELDFIR